MMYIKSADLCERCKYSAEICEPPRTCERCPHRRITILGYRQCLCDAVQDGAPCEYFEEAGA